MSANVPVIVPEKIHLVSVNIIKAQLETTDDFLEKPVRANLHNFGMSHSIANNIEEKRSRFRLFFSLQAKAESGEALGLKTEYGIEFHFFIENFDDFIRTSESTSPQMDINLGATLLGIAYSSARGIIFERTRGTFFNGVILPVIDPFKALLEQGQLDVK